MPSYTIIVLLWQPAKFHTWGYTADVVLIVELTIVLSADEGNCDVGRWYIAWYVPLSLTTGWERRGEVVNLSKGNTCWSFSPMFECWWTGCDTNSALFK